jgi:hypothetical protein
MINSNKAISTPLPNNPQGVGEEKLVSDGTELSYKLLEHLHQAFNI